MVTDYEINGMHHDMVSNYENNLVAWTNENVECIIQGDLSMDELKQMIDSIYKE